MPRPTPSASRGTRQMNRVAAVIEDAEKNDSICDIGRRIGLLGRGGVIGEGLPIGGRGLEPRLGSLSMLMRVTSEALMPL